MGLCLISLTASLSAMEAGKNEGEEFGLEVAVPEEIESDYLLYVANHYVAKKYEDIKKNGLSGDQYWRRRFKYLPFKENAHFLEKMKCFKKFLDVMDAGQKRFKAKETFEDMPDTKRGLWIRLNTSPSDKKEVQKSYMQSDYVYKVIAGSDAVKNYLQEKRTKKRKSAEELEAEMIEAMINSQ